MIKLKPYIILLLLFCMLKKVFLMSILSLGTLCAMEIAPEEKIKSAVYQYSQELTPKETQYLEVLNKTIEENYCDFLEDFFKQLEEKEMSEAFSFEVFKVCLENSCWNALAHTLPDKFSDKILYFAENHYASRLLEIALNTHRRDTLKQFFDFIQDTYLRPEKEIFFACMTALLAEASPEFDPTLHSYQKRPVDLFIDFLIKDWSNKNEYYSLEDSKNAIIEYLVHYVNTACVNDSITYESGATFNKLLAFVCEPKYDNTTQEEILLKILEFKEKVCGLINEKNVKNIRKVLGDKAADFFEWE